MKNQILLDDYYLPDHVESAVGHFVEYYKHERYHESLSNLTSADVYYRRGTNMPLIRRRIRQQTMDERRRRDRKSKAA